MPLAFGKEWLKHSYRDKQEQQTLCASSRMAGNKQNKTVPSILTDVKFMIREKYTRGTLKIMASSF